MEVTDRVCLQHMNADETPPYFTFTLWILHSPCDSAASHMLTLVQVEAKYPALLFKQQLDAFVQKIFPMLRDNVKKEITPQLAACIHAPRTATTRSRRTRDLTTALSGEGPGTPGLPPFPLFHHLCACLYVPVNMQGLPPSRVSYNNVHPLSRLHAACTSGWLHHQSISCTGS